MNSFYGHHHKDGIRFRVRSPLADTRRASSRRRTSRRLPQDVALNSIRCPLTPPNFFTSPATAAQTPRKTYPAARTCRIGSPTAAASRLPPMA